MGFRPVGVSTRRLGIWGCRIWGCRVSGFRLKALELKNVGVGRGACKDGNCDGPLVGVPGFRHLASAAHRRHM